MRIMNQKFVDFVQKFVGQRCAVAVSGGVDSVALLHWLVAVNIDVVALHVNHGLRAAAETEAQYVQDLCKKLNVECHIFHWTGDKPATGLEAAARDARYRMMTDFCRKNGIDCIMIAHQADDQIETFLMNLGRGSGLAGLAAMRRVSVMHGVKIVRPLLDVYRKELAQYCDSRGIKYFHDEMNDDAQYTRVKIRQNRHLLSDKLGISDDRILLAVQNLGRTRDTMDAQIAEMLDSVMYDDFALFSDSFLFDQSIDIRLKFIGTLVQKIGGNDYQPRLKSLRVALDKLASDVTFTLGHCTLRRCGGKILIVREGTKTSIRKRQRHGKKSTEQKSSEK